MLKRFITNNSIINNKVIITDEEHNHLNNVLRLKVGDEIIVTCFDEYDYICKIISITKKQTECTILDKVKNEHNPKGKIDVWQALIKNDKMSLLTQKLNEIGIKNLFLFESKFQTVKPSENKQDKLQKISNQSTKQCRRSLPLMVSKVFSFADMINEIKSYDYVIFANETETKNKLNKIITELHINKRIAIIVGSEGGFDKDEIESIINAGAHSISLGNRILRAETASICLASFVSFVIGN